ncbi:acyl-CoA N-acyltransferase [Fimicolochytrium jonesii]|uniref:acyl-CoA N-acyltransferase n=1 Tax=Fimicolochytrium jonesii TaxID=1396493 RepID=UPI0022FDF649|nr:acyl-CoA N-acyltransferase [Fimicolochytrium jonesii]KAI8824206.1 acyl-CoA N-acyltransferase [Fimicolochytrium jonesii]
MTVRPKLTLQPLTTADIPRAVEIERAAFGPGPLTKRFYPNGMNETSLANLKYRVSKALKDPTSNAHPWKVVRDDTGEMIAYAIWIKPLTKDEVEQMMEKAKVDDPNEPVDTAVNKEFKAAFMKEMFASHGRLMGDRMHWYLRLIATHPDHQGIGAGAVLIDWGLQKAREDSMPAYLESSAAGYPVYIHKGFREIGKMTVDESTSLPCLLWEP